jgi:hypothetical protein
VVTAVLAKPVLTFVGWAGTALMAVTVVALSGPRSAEPVRVVCHEYRSSTTVRKLYEGMKEGPSSSAIRY